MLEDQQDQQQGEKKKNLLILNLISKMRLIQTMTVTHTGENGDSKTMKEDNTITIKGFQLSANGHIHLMNDQNNEEYNKND